MDLLNDVRNAEREGEKLLADARKKSDELIRSAREEARKTLERVEEECREAERRMIAEAESSAYGRSQQAGRENRKVLVSLRSSADGNMESVVKLIVDAIAGN